jgi:large subunit ribosomal protein L3
VCGSVPGPEGGWVEITDAVKRKLPKEAPLPAGLKQAAA